MTTHLGPLEGTISNGYSSLCLMMETDTAFKVYFKLALRWWTLPKITVLFTESELLSF